MDILVTYDVNTLTPEGRRRLRRVAKVCEGFGQRVQESVFECSVNDSQKELLMTRLHKVIEPTEDSLRIYYLRGSRKDCVEAFGLDRYINFKEPLIL
ncbi:MAG: CRISPR-associated endonuclease Cas2 [Alphaproteobacteria bacterium]|nr:MAG: CRISPR-associated endonuclease Cas2 [Alphaproteobacteria bacterium]